MVSLMAGWRPLWSSDFACRIVPSQTLDMLYLIAMAGYNNRLTFINYWQAWHTGLADMGARHNTQTLI